ncbi:hypothetical protein BJ165DRAFT_1432746 [Panaeolus papilionaceus]|nr:hypothetical protein BJ165DRAFT_1432746 [Panaeolus papilionaceus]
MATNSPPPFYILLAQTSASAPGTGPSPNTLQHPVIQYHYSDDSPLSLLPVESQPAEHVVILDYVAGSNSTKASTVRSISKDLVVTGLKVEEAPGAAAGDDGHSRNDRMFIIETVDDRTSLTSSLERSSAQQALAQFKNRQVSHGWYNRPYLPL